MHKRTLNNVRLGAFVLVGFTFLIAALYLIGNNRNLFDDTFQVSATFYKVNGLMKGNNVRFSGIDVGTVKRVEIISDTSVEVTMIIEKSARKFIKKNAMASIGTDGLMGNKLVNINNAALQASPLENGDIIRTIRPIETEQMLRTLDQTNENLSDITEDIKKITQKLNNSNTLWNVLMDTAVAENLKESISAIRRTTRNTATFTNDLNAMVGDVRRGKGLVGFLLTDTSSAAKLKAGITRVNDAGEKASEVARDLKQITDKIKRGEGGAGILLSDSAFAHDLSASMRSIRVGSARLNENMEAMRHNFLFRGYFKKLDKQERKDSIETARKK